MLDKILGVLFAIILLVFNFYDDSRFVGNLVQSNAMLFGMLYVGIIFYLIQENLKSALHARLHRFMETFFRVRYFFILFFLFTLFFARDYVSFFQISYFNDFTRSWFNDTFYVIRQFGYLLLVCGSLYYIHYKDKPEYAFNYLLLFILSFVFIPYSYDLLAFVQDITIRHFWQSTIWTFYTFVNLLLMFVAVMLITNSLLDKNKEFADYTARMSGMLFGFNILWSYLFICQFLIVMYGNVPSITEGYNIRFEYSWLLYQALVMLLHLVLPFFLLFTRRSKTNSTNILMASYSTIMAIMLDFMCYFVPAFSKVGISFYEYLFFIVTFVVFAIIYINSLFKNNRTAIDQNRE